MATANSWIGSPVKRLEDVRFVQGKGCYVGDISPPGLTYGAILRSAVAHARLIEVDVRAALARPGIVGVLTAADFSPVPTIPLRMEPRPELARFAQGVLATTKLRYVGEPIALVVGETLADAEEALELIEVRTEMLPPVLETRAAATGSQHLFEEHATNLAITLRGVAGDTDDAFRSAPYTRSEIFRIHRHVASPMEPRGLLAEWNNETQRLIVKGACKVPFAIRALLAKHMQLDLTAIDVIESDVGGGFGVRGEYYPEDLLIPIAARRFGRPVRWQESRQEHLLATTHARESEIILEIACALDGTVLGLRGDAVTDMGAYIRPNAVTAPRNISQVIAGPYRVPNIDMSVSMVMTNKTPSGSYRGPGRFEADFARERLFDMAATDLGVDTIEFRRKNLVQSHELPYALPTVLPYGAKGRCDSGDYSAALDRCLATINWPRIKELSGRLIDGKYQGVAVGCYIEGGGSGPKENARLEIEVDGQVSVFVGSSALGQGLETVFAQIAADGLETTMQRIKGIYHGSTTYVEEGFGSYASRSVVMGGSAILAAAEKLKSLIKERAAAHFDAPIADIVLDGLERILCRDRAARLEDVLCETLKATGTFSSPDRTYSYGSHAAHVAVDPETGEVEVLNYVAVEDVGRIMNPKTLHGQAYGAIVQGLGGVLLETLVYSDEGQLLTGSMMDYALPHAEAFPNIHVITTEDWPSPFNPLGAKGAGEGGIIPVAGVIGNAIASALSSRGVSPRDLPFTARRVWHLLNSSPNEANSTRADVTPA